MKSFKKFVAEVAQPKPEEEKRFKDQHTYEVIKHPVALDSQFTGDIGKTKAKRSADQEGDANYDKALKNAEKRMVPESVEEATAMTAPPKGSLGGSRPQKRYDAPKGTAKHHADMAAKHQEAAIRHDAMASEYEDEGNHDKADHHYDKMQLHDTAADAHNYARDMIKKHGADHSEAQKASKEANKHKLGESVEQIDEISKELAKKALDKRSAHADKAKRASDKATKGLDHASNLRSRERRKNLPNPHKMKRYGDAATKYSDRAKDAYQDYKTADKKADKTWDYMKKRGMKTESAEQIDEISKELAGRYIKKAQVSSADAGMDTASQDKNIRQRGIKTFLKRRKGVDSAVKRLLQRDESMADDRARYDAADDKNKKKVTLPKAPWDKKDEELSPKQKKIDANKNGKIDGHDLAMLRAKKKNEEVELDEAKRGASTMNRLKDMQDKANAMAAKPKKAGAKKNMDETTSSALKRPVTQTGPDGKTRTVMKKARNDQMDTSGNDKITARESVEMIDEAMKMKRGPMRLKDGSQIMVSKEDADLLNRMFSDLSPNNQRQMQKVMMMDKAGFEEIRGFAREAL